MKKAILLLLFFVLTCLCSCSSATTNEKYNISDEESMISFEFYNFKLSEIQHIFSYYHSLTMDVKITNNKDETHTWSWIDYPIHVEKDDEFILVGSGWGDTFNFVSCEEHFIGSHKSVYGTVAIPLAEDAYLKEFGVYEVIFKGYSFFVDIQENSVTLYEPVTEEDIITT